ncbi:MAG: hypothetical protein N0E58_05075 [Candidatus Thiodiazotropha endolucinida]|uniref:Uncharacterized protein n=1 Tax=Candidatus Thiodiazotropha taylori TaxID=2792791 RepID=A0A9E4NHS9_9GAMM|nr:hypothetical protein [Candidatus Thiodiazotropha sp. (ex Codakia orbicularis)]MCG7977496.1 hypothetical protein [Candidatus Thiodiazotropha taylori]MCW4235621.1 hypothetical protein [Candidatus Thiodiazotropha endolucinida]
MIEAIFIGTVSSVIAGLVVAWLVKIIGSGDPTVTVSVLFVIALQLSLGLLSAFLSVIVVLWLGVFGLPIASIALFFGHGALDWHGIRFAWVSILFRATWYTSFTLAVVAITLILLG